MAGLQYNFFPTDLLYPLQPPAAGPTANDGPVRQVSLVNNWNSDKSEDLKNTNSVNSKGKIVKAVSSSLVAFSPIIHKQKWNFATTLFIIYIQ